MREIKFRAWKNNKRIADICIMYIDENGLVAINPDIADSVEQYTGLRDKNGREIYEGDIVKGDLFFMEEGDYRDVKVVQFENGIFWPFSDGDHGWYNEYSTVIGNIHENPDLVPESDN